MPKTIAILATLDTKGDEAAFLRDEITSLGGTPLLIDVGVVGDAELAADYPNAEVARRGGGSLEALRAGQSRQDAAPVMAAGSIDILRERIASNDVHAVLGLGGTQGTSLCGQVMQALPYGFPKVILSTIASGDTSAFVGIKDVTMMFAVSDILGLNPFSRKMLGNAAGAAFGMAQNDRAITPDADAKGTIAMTNLGVLTKGAMHAVDLFHERGYEVITFHAIGAGGLAMEQMMREGLITGVFDYALGEIADWCFNGLRAADETRLTVAGEIGLPQVICPGGAEHLGLLTEPNVPPEAYRDHQYTFHSPVVFAPRLNAEEISRVGREITKRLASTKGNAIFMIPLHGVSRYSAEGGDLVDPQSDAAFFDTLKSSMPSGVEVREMQAAAEDPEFVEAAVGTLIELIERA